MLFFVPFGSTIRVALMLSKVGKRKNRIIHTTKTGMRLPLARRGRESRTMRPSASKFALSAFLSTLNKDDQVSGGRKVSAKPNNNNNNQQQRTDDGAWHADA